jgi:DNA-binding transcriptional regulator YiaG
LAHSVYIQLRNENTKLEFSVKQNDEPLNQRLERLRREKGLTAKAMAKLIGVAESTYREWEYGRGLKLPGFGNFRHRDGDRTKARPARTRSRT